MVGIAILMFVFIILTLGFIVYAIWYCDKVRTADNKYFKRMQNKYDKKRWRR